MTVIKEVLDAVGEMSPGNEHIRTIAKAVPTRVDRHPAVRRLSDGWHIQDDCARVSRDTVQVDSLVTVTSARLWGTPNRKKRKSGRRWSEWRRDDDGFCQGGH